MGMIAATPSKTSIPSLLQLGVGEILVAVALVFLLGYLDLARVAWVVRRERIDLPSGIKGAVLPLAVTFAIVLATQALTVA